MEALRGVRSLRSAAARFAQERRRVSTQTAKYLKENADLTKLSSEEAAQLGAAKKSPGHGDSPGSFMHQQSNLKSKNKWLQPWLFPIYPMAGMVAIGVGLGVMTAYRELLVNPQVIIDKEKREMPEMHDVEWTNKLARKYAEESPLRKISRQHKISPFGRHLDEDVDEGSIIQMGKLPGDHNPVHGPGGPGRPLGGNN